MMTFTRFIFSIFALILSCVSVRADDAAALTSALPPCPHVEIAVGSSGTFKVVKIRPAIEAICGDWQHLTYSPGGTAGTPEYVVRFYNMQSKLQGEEGISFATGTITFIKSEKYPSVSGTIAFDPKSARAVKLQSELQTYSK